MGAWRRSWEGKHSWSLSPPGPRLVLRRSQEQPEVGKRRKSEKNSLSGGLATQNLDLPRLPLAEPGRRAGARCTWKGR